MTAEPRLTYIEAASQVVQDYLPAGAAGGAWLRPAPDIELIFDRVTGRLCRLTVFAGTSASPESLTYGGTAFLVGHFGPDALERVRRASSRKRAGTGLGPMTDPGGALSALARLRASRATSLIPASPWWDAQEAQLALAAGLEAAARAAAARAVRSLARVEQPAVTVRQAEAALAAADLARPEDADAARQVRARVDVAVVLPVAGYLERRTAGAGGTGQSAGGRVPDGISWALDLTAVPPGTFLPALSAQDDLVVVPGSQPHTVAVSARLAPDADPMVLGQCQARLVVPADRRVLSRGSFSRRDSLAVAELAVPRSVSEHRGA
jgi:hypothetical protein